MDLKYEGLERIGKEAGEKGAEVKAKAEDLLERADELLRRADKASGGVRRATARRGKVAVKGAARLAEDAKQPLSTVPERLADVAGQVSQVAGQVPHVLEQVSHAAGPVAQAARPVAQAAGKVSHAAEDAGGRISRTARRTYWLRHLARPIAFMLGAIVAYRRWGRKWAATWGTTPAERRAPLPGDDIVEVPRRTSTRAISIQAPVSQVWPWLVQMGQGRAGLYSYDWLENLVGCDIHSSDRILPEFQQLSPGDTIRLVRPDFPVDLSFEVAEVDPGRALVLRTPGEHLQVISEGFPYASWAFVVRPQGPSATRLLVRWRSDHKDTTASRVWNGWGIELPHFIMERKMLQGIRDRAQGESQRSGQTSSATFESSRGS